MIYKKIVLKPGQKIFFFSDPHYAHKNICRGTTQWKLSEHGGDDSVRDFDTLEEMNDAIVNGINNMVGQDDWLVCLGDWSFGGIDNVWKFRKRIVCRNLIHILGNHDENIANQRELKSLTNEEFFGWKGGDIRPYGLGTFVENVQWVFNMEVYPYLELTVVGENNKTTYNLFHFPITIWNKAHHDRIHLYGHVHSGYTAPGRSLDVGIDNAFKLFGEYRPFSEEDIAKYMRGRKYNQQSHHNKSTN